MLKTTTNESAGDKIYHGQFAHGKNMLKHGTQSKFQCPCYCIEGIGKFHILTCPVYSAQWKKNGCFTCIAKGL